MYAEFFHLNRKPFRANPKGPEVFVGPQTARIVTNMKSALAGNDAIVAVCGEPGIGKSTLVNRALDASANTMEVVHMPRALLRHDEVLDFLLTTLAIENPPASTIRRVLACRAALAAKAHSGRGVCIVVEDADRIGEDALIEIEALSSADGNGQPGARAVLLGGARLTELLQASPLARLAQRTRLRFEVRPLSAGELLAYLKHGFRLAGGDYDRIFADNVAQVLHELSAGVPRVVNNLIEAILIEAAARKQSRIDASFVAKLGREQFGRQCAVPAALPAAQPVSEARGAPSVSPPAPPKDKQPELSPTPAGRFEPVTATAAVAEATNRAPAAGTGESKRIHDTLPDLEQLAPELARRPQPAADTADIPTLYNSTRMEAPAREAATMQPVLAVAADVAPPVLEPVADEKPSEDVPAWDKDPTLAELRPDIEALERAMAEFSQDAPKKPATDAEADPVVELRDPTLTGVPAITLDVAIQQKIAEATEALQKHDETIGKEPDFAPQKAAEAVPKKLVEAAPKKPVEAAPKKPVEAAPKKPVPLAKTKQAPVARPANDDLQRVAAGIAKAKSIEDVDDKMAETLFGEEFSAIAAAVTANPPMPDDSREPTPDIELQLEETAKDLERPSEAVQSAMEREFVEVYGADAVEVSLQSDVPRAGLDLSASQRLATVRALNAERKLSESARVRDGAANGAHPTRSVPAQSIEEQISTSMTQTLKALNSRPPANDDDNDDDDDDDDGDRKGGFFSRFRKN
jgi:general secretion pathway protein A